jgi:hypothetical protein
MKIRCEHNSIRLRLRKSEIQQIHDERRLQTAVHFPDGSTFAWELILDPETSSIVCRFSNGCIRVHLPEQAAERWINSETVGMESNADGIHLLVEKDFPCKDRPEEDKTDFFQDLADKHPPLC